MIVALANNIEEARELVLKECPHCPLEDLM